MRFSVPRTASSAITRGEGQNRFGARTVTAKPIRIVEVPDDREEANYVVGEIQKQQLAGAVSLDRIRSDLPNERPIPFD